MGPRVRLDRVNRRAAMMTIAIGIELSGIYQTRTVLRVTLTPQPMTAQITPCSVDFEACTMLHAARRSSVQTRVRQLTET
jgi:hypothetical protein